MPNRAGIQVVRPGMKMTSRIVMSDASRNGTRNLIHFVNGIFATLVVIYRLIPTGGVMPPTSSAMIMNSAN